MLNFINTLKCPYCGCDIIQREEIEINGLTGRPSKPYKYREHIDGGRWETRVFACGHTIEYCPNFRMEIESTYRKCNEHPEVIEEKRKQQEIEDHIEKSISELDIDEEIKLKYLGKIKSRY